MAKYIEEGTNYAYTIERIENITFTKLRAVAIDFTRRLPSSLTDELYKDMQHGVCQLQSEPALNMYLYSFGLMHEAKLQHAFQHLPSDFTDHETIEIIDYGCGQAIGTICYADFLRKIGKTQKVKKVTLIEPSKRALERAALHTSCFLPEAEIVTINKGFDDLVEDDLCIDEEIPTLHIFSNVLDLADDYFDLEKFAVLVNNCTRGENYFVSVSPYFDYGEKDEQPYRFFKLLDIKPYYFKISHSGEFIDGKNWTCQVIIGSSNLIGLNKIEKQPASDNKLFSKIDKQNAEVSEWYALGDNCYSQQNYSDAVNWFFKAAEHGHVEAQFKLGNCYEYGNGVPENSEAAARWYRKAAELGCAKAQYNIGYCYEKGEGVFQDDAEAIKWYIKAAKQGCKDAEKRLPDWESAYRSNTQLRIIDIKWLIEAAKQGHSIAQCRLGDYYKDGKIVEKSFSMAVKWYRKSAEQECAGAQYRLARLYSLGWGVEKNDVMAVKWYRLAAEQGSIMAIGFLANHYRRGEGVQQDYDEAIKWYVKDAECRKEDVGEFLLRASGDFDWMLKIAEKGYARAQMEVASYYASGYKTKQSYEDAIYWYRKAIENGVVKAYYCLAGFYEYSKGVAQDYSEAMNLYRKAAENGDDSAQYNIAKFYALGKGVPKSIDKAIDLLTQCKDKAFRLYSIGKLFYDGEEVEQSYEEAIKWWRLAADANSGYAKYMLGDCYKNGQGVERSYEESVKWYKMAIDNNFIYAYVSLGKLYEAGQGVEKSYEKAIELYNIAAKHNYKKAMRCLGDCYRYGLGVKRSYNNTIKWYKMASNDYGQEAQEVKMLLKEIYEEGGSNLLNKIRFRFGFLK